MKHYIVTGRFLGDDEDTALTFTLDDGIDPIEAFRLTMYEDRFGPREDPEKIRAALESENSGVAVNYVGVSDTPISDLNDALELDRARVRARAKLSAYERKALGLE